MIGRHFPSRSALARHVRRRLPLRDGAYAVGSMAYSPAMPASSRFDCDVIVAGGGPAGSAAVGLARTRRPLGAALRARQLSALPHRRVAARVGQRRRSSRSAPTISCGRRVSRRSGARRSCWATARAERYADFGVAPGVPTPQTWQVPRATFDDLLLRHAASSGVDVHERHRILDVAFDADGVTASVHSGRTRDAETRRQSGRARSSTRRAAVRCSRASSVCASTSRGSPTSRCSRTTPACRGRPAAAPATSASSRATISGGSG